MKRRHLLVSASLVLPGVALGSARLYRTHVGAISTPIALGAYVYGAPDNPALLDEFSAMVGVPPTAVMGFQDWTHTGFDPDRMDAVVTRGAMPIVTWEPWDSTRGTNQAAFTLVQILTGSYDSFIQQWARAAAAWGKPFYLRFAHEMNGDWYPWGVGVNGNTAAQYVAVWRRVMNIFRREGATNIRWVWCPDIGGISHGTSTGASSVSYASLYPGDSFVDWVGLDGYNWGTTQSWSSWQDLTTLFGSSYAALARLTNKPMMIAETASTEAGGSKASWMTTGFLHTIPTQFPRIRAVLWFNAQKETDWRVNSTAESLAAYQQIAASATYRGKLI